MRKDTLEIEMLPKSPESTRRIRLELEAVEPQLAASISGQSKPTMGLSVWERRLALRSDGLKTKLEMPWVKSSQRKKYNPESVMKAKSNLIQTSLLGAVLLALPAAVNAQFTFTTNNNAITITGYTGGGTAVIPSTTNGYPVTSIGANAFYNSSVISVTIPASVTSIVGPVFYFCSTVTAINVNSNNPDYSSIAGVLFNKSQTTLIEYPGGLAGSYTIPNSVTSVGDEAFAFCYHLTGIAIPNSVNSFGIGTFEYCPLTSVTIPSSVTSIGSGPFAGCTRLAAITVDTSNPAYSSITGVLFNKNQTTLIQYPGGGAVIYTITNSVTSVKDNSFNGCSELNSITMPNSVTSIGTAAFFNCTSLTSVYFQGNAPTPTNDSSVFSDDNNVTVYYYAGTTGWGATFDGVPTIELIAPLVVITTSLPNGTNGAAYRQTLTASGGQPPYIWTNISGTLPPGLMLATNGVISGKPTTNGTFNFTAKVTDTLFSTAMEALVLQVTLETNPPALTITSPTSNQRWSNAVFTVTGTATDNVAVASVFYLLNNAGWSNAVTVNNWTNWTAAVTLISGTNTIAAYAMDASGNFSTTNRVSFDFVVTNQLGVRTFGLGTVSPNFSNAWLEIGRNYSITSAPATGFVFTNWLVSTNWIGGALVTGTNLQFMMQSNLTLQANFLDVTKPTLSITNLVAGQRWSNLVFTAKGWATDNWQVASVQVQLNGGIWTNATGTTNWSTPLTLTPGTNAIVAYAIDTTGNISPTNSVSFQFVVTNQLLIRITGLGTVSPNYSNAWLEIGRNYSITSAPASGFVFTNWLVSTNWIGAATVTGTNLQFMMQSNLTLQASFVETNKPTLTITAPTSGQHMTNAMAIVTGTAGDIWGVNAVWYQLTNGTLAGGTWSQAATTNNYTNWSTTLTLAAGTNMVKAYAVNLGGIYSATNSVSFVSSNSFKLQLTFGAGQPLAGNGLNFVLQVSTGLVGHVQVSTNLTSWATLTNFVGTNTTITFRDPAATNSSRRFYRAVIP
jgi:hypothetical protein